MRALVLGVLTVVGAPAALGSGPALGSGSVTTVLDGLTAAQRFAPPARALVRLDRTDADQVTTTEIVLAGRGHTLYVEGPDGFRALVRPSKRLMLQNGRVVPAALDVRLGGSDLTLDDLVPVTSSLLRVPQISDEGPTGTVVTGAPTGRTVRALLVLTVDPATRTILRTKAYEGSISDLTTFRRDAAFVDVAGRPRPTEIAVERVRERTTTRATLRWSPAPELPRSLWTPAGLRAPSPLH